MSEQKRSGCKSCLIWFLCLAGFFLVLAGIGLYLGYRKVVSFRDQYTSTKPLAMPAESHTATEFAAMTNRIQQFLAGAEAGRSNVQLSLSAHDLNMLIYESGLSNRAYVRFVSNTVVGQFSLPLDFVRAPVLRNLVKDRYLNAEGAVAVSCENGNLEVNVKDLSVNGQALPESYMSAFRGKNFAEGFATNAEVKQSLEKVQRIAIDDDRLVFEVGTNRLH